MERGVCVFVLYVIGIGGLLLLLGTYGGGCRVGPEPEHDGSDRAHFGTLKWDLSRDRSLKAVGWHSADDIDFCIWQNIKRLDLTLPDGVSYRFDDCYAKASRRGGLITGMYIDLPFNTTRGAVDAMHKLMNRSGESGDDRGLEAWASEAEPTPKGKWGLVPTWHYRGYGGVRSYGMGFGGAINGDPPRAWTPSFGYQFR